MDGTVLGLAIAGVLCAGMGLLMALRQGFSEWYVLRSGKGRLWARILGEERAIAAMRRAFGPLAILIGLALAYAAYTLASKAA